MQCGLEPAQRHERLDRRETCCDPARVRHYFGDGATGPSSSRRAKRLRRASSAYSLTRSGERWHENPEDAGGKGG
jgi:hypothetical protein